MNIHIAISGNLGNRILYYLTAAGLRARAPGATITNILLPAPGMDQPSPHPTQNFATTARGWIDSAGYADCLSRGVIESVVLGDYPFHLDNYPSREDCRRLIPTFSGGEHATGFGPDTLVCSLRGGEILNAVHQDYLVLPPAYYQMLAQKTGLSLVFFGQPGDDPYTDSLRRAFPDTKFIAGTSPAHDFETLRRSANIALSVSTFAWAAAWLSHAQKIFLPVCGFLNPVQHAEQLFLPFDDNTFEYTLFPYAKAENLWSNPARFFLQQDVLARAMRPTSPAELQDITTRTKPFHLRRPLVAGFDPVFYLNSYPDVREAVGKQQPSALQHYLTAGIWEGRAPLEFDVAYYVSTYPDAAMAIAEGHFANALHHYQAVGWAKGFRPTP